MISHEALQFIWFGLVGVLLTGYAILDGFDLGAGLWHLFAKGDKQRRLVLNSIGPVWDGNEVWLITGGGALFAAFPPVYASVFSGFYLALMLVLFGLIFRAVSIEFRSKMESPTWRSLWDAGFSIGSLIPALLFGVALGNVARGIPLDAQGNYTGGFWGLLNPYALLVGLTGLAMIATQGALWLAMKNEGDLAQSARSWAGRSWPAYAVLFVLTTIWGMAAEPQMMTNFKSSPTLFVIPVLAAVFIAAVSLFLRSGDVLKAFLANSLSVVALMGTVGAAIYPYFVPSLGDAMNGLSIYEASSSQLTLQVMFVVAVIGVPIVLAYTVFIYRTFRGKVRLEENSY